MSDGAVAVTSPSAVTLRELDRASEALGLLEPHEPASTLLVAAVLERGLGRLARCWLAEEEGRPIGALAVSRLHVDGWHAHPLILEPAAAPTLALAADGSAALSIAGPADHVDPLLGHLLRGRGRFAEEFLRLPEGAFLPEYASDPRIRIAQLRDLDELVDLYRGYDLERIPLLRLRTLLRETIRRRMILVADYDGRIAGAHRLVAWSRRWAMWDHLMIAPEARRQGLAWALVHRGAMESSRRGRRWMTPKNPRNPMAFPEQLGAESSEWVVTPLVPRRRFKGQWRLRFALERAENRLAAGSLGRRLAREVLR